MSESAPDAMHRLWSPWRSQHVSEFEQRHQGGSGGVFRRIAESPLSDDPLHFVVWRGELVFVVMNLYPYNNGHLLIVPYREVARYIHLTAAEQAEIATTLDRAMGWLDAALRPEGYNVGINEGSAGGAGIPEHLHVHVVPRWSGDTNFLPVTGDLKVIPEAMEDTYHKLVAAVDGSGDSRR